MQRYLYIWMLELADKMVKWSENAQATVPSPEWSPALALHCPSLQQTLHLSCTTGQVTVASSRLREISFTHTMTRFASSPNLPSLEELQLNLQCTNSSSCPWHLSIETCLSVCCLYYESKKNNTLEDRFSVFTLLLEQASWTEQAFYTLNNGDKSCCWFLRPFRALMAAVYEAQTEMASTFCPVMWANNSRALADW